jgi:glycosyltransferase involved in cell wall biosynthesis
MIYIDVRPLMTSEFTGIPQLTWHLTRFWLNRRQSDLRFFIGTVEIDRALVEKIVAQRSGRYVQGNSRELHAGTETISPSAASKAIGIYPHTRAHRNKQFLREVQVIHDLTGVLTPEFHPRELVEWEMLRAINDIPQIDHFICVSNSSRQDLCRYYEVDETKTTVAYPGVEWFDSHRNVYQYLSESDFEPYVLVLGTFEPRKNIEIVFEYIKANLDITKKFRFIFCGSQGWGGIYDRCVSDPGIYPLIESGSIKIISFVNERLKFALIKEASFLIYPSFLEGFGSPVAEALSLGVPVVLSYGGSLPEVAGKAGYYFDPYDPKTLENAINKVNFDLTYKNAETRIRAYNQGQKFTWDQFNEKILTVVESLEAAEAA